MPDSVPVSVPASLFDLELTSGEVLWNEVLAENKRQLAKWGRGRSHTAAEWALILGEEVGELNRELLGLHFGGSHFTGRENLRKEAIQVATLALKIAEMFEVK